MYSSDRQFVTRAVNHDAALQRDQNGVPRVTAGDREDLNYGIGWAQTWDRQVQMVLVRAIAQGRASEKFSGDDELIEIDRYMRWLNLGRGLDRELDRLTPEAARDLAAYSRGVNAVLTRRRPLEFRLVRHRPEEWTPADCLLTLKAMGYIGLAQAQGDAEKFILQLVRAGLDETRLKSLFPSLTDKVDYDLLGKIKGVTPLAPPALFSGKLPTLKASNNWVVAGSRTASGAALLASDPHMEVNRLPALWYEMVFEIEDRRTMGITMPGLPLMVFGRTRDVAWGGTYGFMDMIDFFVEDCRGGEYRDGDEWLPLETRIEVIRPKKKPPLEIKICETARGVLENAPEEPGLYLVMAFTGRNGAGAEAFNLLLDPDRYTTADQAMDAFKHLSMPTMNWVFADSQGNIGYQMCGRMPQRPDGVSGLLPAPGWDSSQTWQGFVSPDLLPRAYNPEEGFFATANDDLNRHGQVAPINLPMSWYRAERIRALLRENDSVDPGLVRQMHGDLYSLEAERLMPLYRPLLPDTENGRLLAEWDLTYQPESLGAMLFESVYFQSLRLAFGRHGFGEDLFDHLWNETGIFVDYHLNFDDVLLDENSPWFAEQSREALLTRAVELGLAAAARPYGKTRKYDLNNIFFSGRLPAFLGFDVKGRTLPGNRATISQGQIYRNAGRDTTFAPSFRMIAEMDRPGLWTNIAGGPAGGRFSRWYKSGLDDWAAGRYKKLD